MLSKFKKFFILSSLFVFAAIIYGCDGDEIKYLDVVERPTDIEELDYNQYVKYPSKPAKVDINTSLQPSIGEFSVSENSKYNLEIEDEKTKICYEEVINWSYVYIPIENYNKNLSNIKIKATGQGAERIAIQVVYYEMYDLNYKPITVYLGDISDQQQNFILQFNKYKLLNEAYNQVENTKLGEQTILGLCLFIDSNPSQLKVSDGIGSLLIDDIKFLPDGDEELNDIYVAPSIGVGYCDIGYSSTKDEESGKITINRESGTSFWTKSYLTIANYSSDYTAFNLKFNTTGVKSIRISFEFNVEGNLWQNSVDVYTSDVSDGDHEKYIDFSSLQPISSVPPYNYVTGYYVKNYKITSIHVYLDTYEDGFVPDFDATCVIEELKFERTVVEGTTISKGWNSSTNSIIIKDDIMNGGIGTIEYSSYNDWDYLTMPVLKYEEASKLTITFQTLDELDYIGIAIVANGVEFVLKSCWEKVEVIEEKMGTVEGMVESVDYDETNKIYTISFDFIDMVKLVAYNNLSANQLAVTALRFYLTDPYDGYFEGLRTIRFISVEFS